MAEFVENLHPRAPKGSEGGGRFVSKGGGSAALASQGTGGWKVDANDRREIARYKKAAQTESIERPTNLTAEESQAVDTYCNGTREVRDPKILSLLDDATMRYQLPENIVLHRSLRLAAGSNKSLTDLQPYDIISDPRFISASMSPMGTGPQVLILAAKGMSVLPTGYYDEMLIPRNTRLQYMGEEQDGSRYFRMLTGVGAQKAQEAAEQEKVSAEIIPFPQEEDAAARLNAVGTDVGAQKTEADKRLAMGDFRKAKIHVSSVGDEEFFLKEWESKIGKDPGQFKKEMLGNYDGEVSVIPGQNEWSFTTALHDESGQQFGTYDHTLNFRTKVAYLGYIKLDRNVEGKGIGKKIMAARVDMLKELGMKKDTLHANIDVGSYAWAKYGYVPNPGSWPEIASEVEAQLPEPSEAEFEQQSEREELEDRPEPESWDTLTNEQQESVHDQWIRNSRSEFYDSEVDSWRDNGDQADDARELVTDEFNNGTNIEWAEEALNELRSDRLGDDEPDFPYTNEQILDAIKITHERGYGRDREPELEFVDTFLREPSNAPPPEQKMLPGFERPDLATHLTDEMRNNIKSALLIAFRDRAERREEDIDPPSWLRESAEESQEDYWDQMNDDDRWDWAERNTSFGETSRSPVRISFRRGPEMNASDAKALRELARSNDPKAMWGISDSRYGKELLMNRHWYGDLVLDDKDTMERFNAYVGKSHAEQQRKAA